MAVTDDVVASDLDKTLKPKPVDIELSKRSTDLKRDGDFPEGSEPRSTVEEVTDLARQRRGGVRLGIKVQIGIISMFEGA